MAHFAKIDQTGTVIDIIVVDTENLLDEDGNESEEKGIEFLKSIFRDPYDWKQTSYNACRGNHRKVLSTGEIIYGEKECLRKNYASIGGKYDYERDAFIANRLNEGQTILDEEKCDWITPYQSNQATDNDGNPLDYEDSSDYSSNKDIIPSGWIWDNQRKTYLQVELTEAVKVSYRYDENNFMWVKE